VNHCLGSWRPNPARDMDVSYLFEENK